VIGCFSEDDEPAAEAARAVLKGQLRGEEVGALAPSVDAEDEDDRFPIDYGLPPKGRSLLMAAAAKGLPSVVNMLIEECGAVSDFSGHDTNRSY
jgi:hypothetical protein